MLKTTASASFNCLSLRQPPQLAGSSSSFLLDKSCSDHQAPEDEEAEQDEEYRRRTSKSCIPAAAIFQSWLVSLVLRGRNSKKPGLGDEKKHLVWRILLQRLASEVHCRRRKVVRGIRSSGVKKQIDFSYDESSYAKNFDMGHENWLKNDPGFRIQELTTTRARKMNEPSR